MSNSEHKLTIRYLVKALIKYKASDLHLKVGRPPLFRVNGRLVTAKMPDLTEKGTEAIIGEILSSKQRAELESKRQIDFSFKIQDLGRFRCNVYFQRNTLSAAIRMIPYEVPSLDELGLPSVIKELCNSPRGLIIITGATGSGKSTTLAAMIQHINETSHLHILSIEDPIEFVYHDLKSSISQREIGSDALSMKDALLAGLRQDPDVILLGEVRDADTIEVALTAAETGHLVLTTLHTNDARSTIDRILDVFKLNSQNQIRVQLAYSLIAIIAQQLLPRADGQGQVLACEVLIKSPVIADYIRRNELDRIQEAMAHSKDYYHMQTMNQALEDLIKRGLISMDEGLKASTNQADLKLRLSGIDREEGYDTR